MEEEEEIKEKLTKEEIEDEFNYNYHLSHVDEVLARLGLGD